MKKLSILFTAFAMVLVGACSSTPELTDKTANEGRQAGLNKVANSRFDSFYLLAGQDLSRFDSVKFEPLKLNAMELDQKRLDMRDRNWEITDTDREDMQRRFAERVERTFPEGGALALVENLSDNTVTVQFEFTRFMPSASQDRGANRGIRDKVWSRSVGLLEIKAELYDNNGTLIAYLEDAQEVGERIDLQRNDRVNNIRLMNLEIDRWLNKLTETLGSLKSGALNSAQ